MSSEQNKVILRAEHISKTYGEKKVLEDISIHLEQGELVSLLGVSGSGKTTLFNVLSGIITPDEGKVYLKDQDITSAPGSISYMLQKDLLLRQCSTSSCVERHEESRGPGKGQSSFCRIRSGGHPVSVSKPAVRRYAPARGFASDIFKFQRSCPFGRAL